MTEEIMFQVLGSGSVTTEGDVAMRANIARDIFGVDGTGITVGILSDSFNILGGEEADILSGDLPGANNPFGYTTPVLVLSELLEAEGATDEARAMAQIIHDIAPAARLMFHTAFNGFADYAEGIRKLAQEGADIIVSDVVYPIEPMFQDGLIAQAVDEVVEQGVLYFSSSGNNGRVSYESEFRGVPDEEVGLNPDYLWHDFDPSPETNIFQEITLDAGEVILLSFQWDQPHASSGGLGSQNDLDIFLMDSERNIIAGANELNVGGDAVEVFGYENEGSEGTFFLLIGQNLQEGGPTPGLIKYIDTGGGTKDAQFSTFSSTIYGNANSKGAAGVGAVLYSNTPEFGVNPPELQPFSSVGGVPILFDTEGNRITPETRQEPRFVAPDGVNNTFFGRPRPDGDGFSFLGSSASSPHVAGVAALMLQHAPETSPDTIYNILKDTAIDMNEPGFDFESGYGLVQADAAMRDLLIDSSLDTSIYRFRTGNATYIYVGEEERQRIIDGNYGFVEEGEAFKVASTKTNDLLEPIYRFRNNDLAGAYLYVGEEERQSIKQNYSQFVEEGLAFYVYGADAPETDQIYRFQTQPGGYIFVGNEERQSILEGGFNFASEGTAFGALL